MGEKSVATGSALHGVAEARAKLVDAVSPLTGIESVALDDALGRVLAGPVKASVNVPPADNSAMDGYAMSAEALHDGGGVLPVSTRIQAGDSPEPLVPGTAARIFTGAVIPDGADAVVIQEKTSEQDGKVYVEGALERGNNIRRAGEDMRVGDEILEAGIRLRPQELGLLASTGIDEVGVLRPVRVTILSTGDELVAPGKLLARGQIYNSNKALVRALLASLGCEVAASRHVPDTPEATRSALEAAAEEADLIVSTGGVSVGEADYVKSAVEQLGRLDLWKIAVKPGKPLAFGRVGEAVFVGLPGNPVSAFVTFCLFAAPVIRKMQGRVNLIPQPVPIPAAFSVDQTTREEYLRVRASQGRLERYPHQGSGVLSSAVWASGLARIPAGVSVEKGDFVEYFSFEALLA